MKIRSLHSWSLNTREAASVQTQLSTQIVRSPLIKPPRWIAGADISFNKKSPIGFAGVVLMDAQTLTIVDTHTLIAPLEFPYIPGFLSFREAPLLLKVFSRVKPKPHLVFLDGHGLAHPRGLGLASHLGLLLNCPTVGCAKSRLVGEYSEPGPLKGEQSPLKDDSGKTLGTVLRTRDHCKPMFISIGHRIDLRSAVKWTLKATTRYRIPEPTRQAHLLVNQLRRDNM